MLTTSVLPIWPTLLAASRSAICALISSSIESVIMVRRLAVSERSQASCMVTKFCLALDKNPSASKSEGMDQVDSGLGAKPEPIMLPEAPGTGLLSGVN